MTPGIPTTQNSADEGSTLRPLPMFTIDQRGLSGEPAKPSPATNGSPGPVAHQSSAPATPQSALATPPDPLSPNVPILSDYIMSHFTPATLASAAQRSGSAPSSPVPREIMASPIAPRIKPPHTYRFYKPTFPGLVPSGYKTMVGPYLPLLEDEKESKEIREAKKENPFIIFNYWNGGLFKPSVFDATSTPSPKLPLGEVYKNYAAQLKYILGMLKSKEIPAGIDVCNLALSLLTELQLILSYLKGNVELHKDYEHNTARDATAFPAAESIDNKLLELHLDEEFVHGLLPRPSV